ncbi:hypothetical protein [Nonomuraea sp. NPDC049480]|uniref:hypothetical protein n=1 Tax=Nonomuraea sp. NPDC049480 TaxID=3364353 RepID=UPI003794A17A
MTVRRHLGQGLGQVRGGGAAREVHGRDRGRPGGQRGRRGQVQVHGIDVGDHGRLRVGHGQHHAVRPGGRRLAQAARDLGVRASVQGWPVASPARATPTIVSLSSGNGDHHGSRISAAQFASSDQA